MGLETKTPGIQAPNQNYRITRIIEYTDVEDDYQWKIMIIIFR